MREPSTSLSCTDVAGCSSSTPSQVVWNSVSALGGGLAGSELSPAQPDTTIALLMPTGNTRLWPSKCTSVSPAVCSFKVACCAVRCLQSMMAAVLGCCDEGGLPIFAWCAHCCQSRVQRPLICPAKQQYARSTAACMQAKFLTLS